MSFLQLGHYTDSVLCFYDFKGVFNGVLGVVTCIDIFDGAFKEFLDEFMLYYLL